MVSYLFCLINYAYCKQVLRINIVFVICMLLLKLSVVFLHLTLNMYIFLSHRPTAQQYNKQTFAYNNQTFIFECTFECNHQIFIFQMSSQK